MTGQDARDDEREALDYAIRTPIAKLHVDYRPFWRLIRDIQDSVWAAGFRKHPEPEITEEQARAVTTVDAIATSTGMSRADVVATVRAIGEPLHGWEYAITRLSSPGESHYRMHDLASARRFVENPPIDVVQYEDDPFLIVRRAASGPWVPVGEGEQ